MTSFRDLHVPGDPFVLANAWDIGTARVLAALGAPALATSSAAHAFTLGLPDGGHVGRDAAVAHAAGLAAAVEVPVSADLENGYGPGPDDVVATVDAAAAAGLAGLCIEDTDLPGVEPHARHTAVERIAAGVEAAGRVRAGGRDVFLVARADGLMLGRYDLTEAIARCRDFAAAGADGVYVPALPDLDAVRALCAAVDVPVNVLAVGEPARHGVAGLAGAGVARISLGSTLARRTQQALLDAATAIYGLGDFGALSPAASGDAVDGLLARGARPAVD